MKKILTTLLISMITLGVVLTGCSTENNSANDVSEDKLTVAVGIVPEESFVKAVAGDSVNIVTMIPPGRSTANYQPSPKEMREFSEASVYFAMGVPAENSNIIPKAKELNEDVEIVNLAHRVGEVHPHRYFDKKEGHSHDDNDHKGRDPHIWMSPKRVKVMIDIIRDELVKLNPDKEDMYHENAKNYKEKLDNIDKEIKNTLSKVEEQSFIIYHPSFGYFADDYGLNMIAIEESGKEATPKKLAKVIDIAKQKDIKFVFYQKEFDSQQAETIADEINGETIEVAPLSKDYIDNMREISDKFKNVLK